MAKAKSKSKGAAAVADPQTLSSEGMPLTKGGEVDKRYQGPPSDKLEKTAQPPGVSRRENIEGLFTGRQWEMVDEGFDAAGVKSATGAKLKRFYRIKDTSSGEVLIVGRGEMIKYANITPPRKSRSRGQSTEEFEAAFTADGSVELEDATILVAEISSDDDEEESDGDDLSFIDSEEDD